MEDDKYQRQLEFLLFQQEYSLNLLRCYEHKRKQDISSVGDSFEPCRINIDKQMQMEMEKLIEGTARASIFEEMALRQKLINKGLIEMIKNFNIPFTESDNCFCELSARHNAEIVLRKLK